MLRFMTDELVEFTESLRYPVAMQKQNKNKEKNILSREDIV